MNIKRIIAVALAAAFAVTAGAEENKADKKIRLNLERIQTGKKKSLKKENAQLRAELDSLRMEVEKYREELAYTDSLTGEMLDGLTRREDCHKTRAFRYLRGECDRFPTVFSTSGMSITR